MSSFIPRDLPDFAAVDVLSGIAVMDIATGLQNFKLDGDDNFVINDTLFRSFKYVQLKISTSASAHKDASPTATSSDTITLLEKSFPKDEWTNITPRVADKLGKNLHLQVRTAS